MDKYILAATFFGIAIGFLIVGVIIFFLTITKKNALKNYRAARTDQDIMEQEYLAKFGHSSQISDLDS